MASPEKLTPEVPADFKQVLLDTTWEYPNRALPDSVKSIEWGDNWAAWAKEMLRESATRNVEVGRSVKVHQEPGTKNRKLLVHTQPTIGSEDMVATGTKINTRNRVPLDRIATLMHTHARYNLPPSPQDCRDLLQSGDNPTVETAVTVLTPAQKILIFRSPRSPQLTLREAEQHIAKWSNDVQETPQKFNVSSLEEDVIAQIYLLFMRVELFSWRIFTAPLDSKVFISVEKPRDLVQNLPDLYR